MLFGRQFRDEQHEEQVDRRSIRRVESNRRLQAEECTAGFLQPLDPAVRYGDPSPKPGGAQLLAGKQTVEHGTAGNALIVLE